MFKPIDWSKGILATMHYTTESGVFLHGSVAKHEKEAQFAYSVLYHEGTHDPDKSEMLFLGFRAVDGEPELEEMCVVINGRDKEHADNSEFIPWLTNEDMLELKEHAMTAAREAIVKGEEKIYFEAPEIMNEVLDRLEVLRKNAVTPEAAESAVHLMDIVKTAPNEHAAAAVSEYILELTDAALALAEELDYD